MKAFDSLERGQEVRGRKAGKMTKVGLAYDVARKIWHDDRRWAAKGWLICDLAAYILGDMKEGGQRPVLDAEVVVLMKEQGVDWRWQG